MSDDLECKYICADPGEGEEPGVCVMDYLTDQISMLKKGWGPSKCHGNSQGFICPSGKGLEPLPD